MHAHLKPLAGLLSTWLLSGCISTQAPTDAASHSNLPPGPLLQLQGLPVQDAEGRAAEALQRYQRFPGYKAAAVALAIDGRWAAGAGQSAPNQLAAVQTAMAACDEGRASKQIDAPCELLNLGDEELEIGRAMRLRLHADQPDTPALIWRFSHGNTVLHVAGSIHAQRATALPLPAALTEAYADADTLLVELDITAVDAAQQRAAARQSSMLPPGQTLEQTLPVAELQQFRSVATELGVPWQQLNVLRPGAAMNVVAIAALQTAGFDPSQGVESLLLQRAHADRKKIESLETYEMQVALLSDATPDPPGTGIEAGLTTAALRAGIQQLNDAWMRADTRAVMRLFGLGTGDTSTWTARLLDARNARMAARAIDHLQQQAGPALMVVGAGHLPGANGIVALLESAGFAGTQLTRGGAPVPTADSQPQADTQPQAGAQPQAGTQPHASTPTQRAGRPDQAPR